MTLSKKLRAILEAPDDLSNLPQLITDAEAMEAGELSLQEQITRLQTINKQYLSQIPVPGDAEPAEEDVLPAEEVVTDEDIQKYLETFIEGA